MTIFTRNTATQVMPSTMQLLWRFVLALIVACYLAVGILYFGGKWAISLLPGLSTTIETYLDQKTGLYWRIENLRGEMKGIHPVIYVSRVSAAKTKGELEVVDRQVFALDSAHIYINIISSLVNRSLQIHGAQLSASRMVLALENRRLTLDGMRTGESSPKSLSRAINILDGGKYIDITIDQLSVIEKLPDDSIRYQRMPSVSIQLNQFGERGQINAVFDSSISPSSNNFEINMAVAGDFFSRDDDSYMGLTGDLGVIVPWLNIYLPDKKVSALDGDVFIRRRNGEITAIVDRFQLTTNVVSLVQETKTTFSLGLYFQQSRAGMAVLWHDVSVVDNEKLSLLPDGGYLSSHQGIDQKSLDFGSPNIAALHPLVSVLYAEAHPVNQLVSTLNSRGVIDDLRVDFVPDNESVFVLSATLNNVSVDPWVGAPGLTGLYGTLQVNQRGGKVLVDTLSPVSMHFPKIYREPLRFSQMSGEVSWQIEGNRYLISSGDIVAHSMTSDAQFGGRFSVNGGVTASQEATQLMLNLGVTSAAAQELLQYIPYVAPQPLLGWVAHANLSGDVEKGAFLYNGSVRADEGNYRSINAYFKVENAALTYFPEWPKVAKVIAEVHVDNELVSVEVETGESSQLTMTNGVVDVFFGDDQAYVDVIGDVSGEVTGVLDFLTTAPLPIDLSPYIGSWRGRGMIKDARVDLHIPLDGEFLDDFTIDTGVTLLDAKLNMKNIGISVDAISGFVGFSDQHGLYSRDMQGELWGNSLDIQLGDILREKNSLAEEQLGKSKLTNVQLRKTENVGQQQTANTMSHLMLRANGVVDTRGISSWLTLPIFEFIKGESLIELAFVINDSGTQLDISSNLQGVLFDFPDAIGKSKNSSADLSMNWRMDTAIQPLRMEIDNRFMAQFLFQDFEFLSGDIVLGADASLGFRGGVDKKFNLEKGVKTSPPSIAITGSSTTVNFYPWQTFVERYLQYQSGASNAEQEAFAFTIENFRIGALNAFGETFNRAVLDVKFSEETQRWMFDIESDELLGAISLPRDEALYVKNELQARNHGRKNESTGNTQRDMAANVDLAGEYGFAFSVEDIHKDDRIIVDLKYLRMAKNDRIDADDPLTAMHFWDLPNISVAIDQLYFNERAYGNWQFLFTSGANTALVHDVRGIVDGLSITSDTDSGLLWARRSDGRVVSLLDMAYNSEQVSRVPLVLGYRQDAFPIISDHVRGDILFSWEGAPYEFSLDKVDGDLTFEFDRGRFLQTSASTTGILKLVGLLNFDLLLRRIQLDFSDVYKEGLSFDTLSGKMTLLDNQISFYDRPIVVTTPGSNFSLTGEYDLDGSIIDAELTATLPVASNLPWIAALALGLPVAAGTYVVTKVLDKQFEKLSSAVYKINGNIDDPNVKFDRLFEKN